MAEEKTSKDNTVLENLAHAFTSPQEPLVDPGRGAIPLGLTPTGKQVRWNIIDGWDFSLNLLIHGRGEAGKTTLVRSLEDGLAKRKIPFTTIGGRQENHSEIHGQLKNYMRSFKNRQLKFSVGSPYALEVLFLEIDDLFVSQPCTACLNNFIIVLRQARSLGIRFALTTRQIDPFIIPYFPLRLSLGSISLSSSKKLFGTEIGALLPTSEPRLAVWHEGFKSTLFKVPEV